MAFLRVGFFSLFYNAFQSVLEKLEDASVVRECSLCMVQCKVLKRLELLAQKDLSHDPEMTDDLKFLQVSSTSST